MDFLVYGVELFEYYEFHFLVYGVELYSLIHGVLFELMLLLYFGLDFDVGVDIDYDDIDLKGFELCSNVWVWIVVSPGTCAYINAKIVNKVKIVVFIFLSK